MIAHAQTLVSLAARPRRKPDSVTYRSREGPSHSSVLPSYTNFHSAMLHYFHPPILQFAPALMNANVNFEPCCVEPSACMRRRGTTCVIPTTRTLRSRELDSLRVMKKTINSSDRCLMQKEAGFHQSVSLASEINWLRVWEASRDKGLFWTKMLFFPYPIN